jgi:hypothetical protein
VKVLSSFQGDQLRKAMIKKTVLFCALLALLFVVVDSVDRTKFKTCHQSGFCNRNRNLVNAQERGQYQVKADTLQKPSSSKLTAKVQSPNNKEFQMELTTLNKNVVRLRIFEEHQNRYMGPQDLLEKNLKESSFEEIKRSQNSYEFSLGTTIKGTMGFAPFALGIIS